MWARVRYFLPPQIVHPHFQLLAEAPPSVPKGLSDSGIARENSPDFDTHTLVTPPVQTRIVLAISYEIYDLLNQRFDVEREGPIPDEPSTGIPPSCHTSFDVD